MSPICRRDGPQRCRGRTGPTQMWCGPSGDRGVEAPWSHQLAAADLARDGRHVVLSTGTASGKSLAYQLPILTALKANPRARALYLAPTKALGHDQLRAAAALTEAVPGARRRRTESVRRRQSRRGAALRARTIAVDLLQPGHDPPVAAAQPRPLGGVPAQSATTSWSTNAITTVAFSDRTWRWCCGGCCDCAPATRRRPTVIFASATTAHPAATASELIGQTVAEVTEDGSPHGARTVALWEPALREDIVGENGAPVRRSAGAEAARVMADLIAEGARTLTFVRSRRGAELTALGARARLEDMAPELAERVASYRAGYLAEDRRATRTRAGRRRAARRGHDQRAGTWAWTSRDSMPWCWPAFRAPSRRSGSRQAVRAVAGRARSSC